jgi:hypothetical protein
MLPFSPGMRVTGAKFCGHRAGRASSTSICRLSGRLLT